MKTQYLVIFLLAVLVITGCKEVIETPEVVESVNTSESGRVKGADYQYCIGIGYEYEHRDYVNGSEEYCIFPNGEECVAFDFITGECHREFSLCERQGHMMVIGVEEQEGYTAKYGVCMFEDGSYCKEYDFFKGNCHVKWK